MAVAVEHEKRRIEILEKALAVFVDDGFENATFQKIADRCGINRTILYLYFKNKKEIFNFSIKQMLLKAEGQINVIRSDFSLSCIEKITKILLVIFKLLEQNHQLLSVVLDYLLHISKSGTSPEERVRRRTGKVRHILLLIIREGIKKGEFKKINLKLAGNYLYSYIEAAIFQLVVLKRKNLDELTEATIHAVKQLAP